MNPAMHSRLSRRQLLRRSALGFGNLALMGLMSPGLRASGSEIQRNPLAARAPLFRSKAKRIIFLFMHGGPSHVDTFDWKPRLLKDSGKPLPFDKPRIQFAKTSNLRRSPWEFRPYGQSGAMISDLFPLVGARADDLCFIKSIHGTNEAHGGALLKLNTGSDTVVRPSMGSWITYGLGSENRNLPGFITINPTLGHGGVNRDHLTSVGTDAVLEAQIEAFELAFRMQSEAPEAMDIDRETPATRKLYGLDDPKTSSFARQCLLARRFSERGVRFVQASHGYWDQHSDLTRDHGRLASEVDRPIAALLQDLKARGLWDETLVMWGGEFGRTPTLQGDDGRDHHPHAFTMWLAGGAVKPGFSYGVTDDYGFYCVDQKVHVHDLHATLLALLGMDHEALTYRHAGRDFRLTDVHGRVVQEIFA
jgi:hypothetical protein